MSTSVPPAPRADHGFDFGDRSVVVAGGTSGHLLGGSLAAILLGPWAAVLVMTAVIGVQALLFLDGGLLTAGAVLGNIMLLINAYWLWEHRREYRPLLNQTS